MGHCHSLSSKNNNNKKQYKNIQKKIYIYEKQNYENHTEKKLNYRKKETPIQLLFSPPRYKKNYTAKTSKLFKWYENKT